MTRTKINIAAIFCQYASGREERYLYRLIVVDDEKFIRESVISFEWESIGVQPIDCFESGEKTLSYLAENPVDIVLTDICMPGMTGVTLVAKIKEIDPDIVVICISGYSDYEYLRACLQVGANDYLLKPIDKEELFETVRNLLSDKDSSKEKIAPDIEEEDENKVQHHYISIVLKYIDDNYADSISLKKVAEIIGFNPVYLGYLFKKIKKENFSEYLNKVRLKKAEELLTNSTLKIGEIAEKAGYKDARYFSSLFKKRTGMSPNEYRNKKDQI